MRENDKAVRLRIKAHIRFESDRTCCEYTGRYNNRSSSRPGTLVYGFLDSLCGEQYACLVCPVVQYVKRAVRELRHFHLRHLERRRFGKLVNVVLLGRLILRRSCTGTQHSCNEQQKRKMFLNTISW